MFDLCLSPELVVFYFHTTAGVTANWFKLVMDFWLVAPHLP